MEVLNSKQKGNLTELLCIAAFVKLGITVSIPYGDCARYDFIADIDGKLYRIQCKTSTMLSDGVYQFSCRSTTGNTVVNSHRSYDSSQIDFFATIIDNQCYLIPVQETGSKSKTLRFTESKNPYIAVNYAQDYELETQLLKLKG